MLIVKYFSNNKNIKMEIQKQILEQLGGASFVIMVGAKCIVEGKNTLVVKFKCCKRYNIVYITLNSFDYYDMKFAKYILTELYNVTEFHNVDCENLRSIFEETTNLRTSLTKVFATKSNLA